MLPIFQQPSETVIANALRGDAARDPLIFLPSEAEKDILRGVACGPFLLVPSEAEKERSPSEVKNGRNGLTHWPSEAVVQNTW